MQKVLITGSSGQLGADLVKTLSEQDNLQVIAASRADADIVDFAATRKLISRHEPDTIIHCAAYTDVDKCETNSSDAYKVNAIGTRNVAISAREIDAKLVYISTDYVFDGSKEEPYLECDQPNPINVYGRSKLWGEDFVREQLHKFFIIRTAWLYSQHGDSFVKTMLKLAEEREELQVVNDQRGTPTYTEDLARQIKELILTELYGTYHCTSQGSCSWYEFALEIFKSAGYELEVASDGSAYLVPADQQPRTKNQELGTITLTPVTSEAFPRPAKRPANSVLENYMLRLQGLDIMPHWKDSLHKFMKSSQQSMVSSQRRTVKRQEQVTREA